MELFVMGCKQYCPYMANTGKFFVLAVFGRWGVE